MAVDKTFDQRTAEKVQRVNDASRERADQDARGNGFQRGGGVDATPITKRADDARDASNAGTRANPTDQTSKVAEVVRRANGESK